MDDTVTTLPDASNPLETVALPQQGADLVVALDGFDGPIDLLLSLARDQKVDLAKLSILDLAEQYLAYIASARKLHLEVAADYLVMAAWLAFLKSRLLLPELPEEEGNPVDLAEALKFQLLRLEAMQKASGKLFERPQLGTDFFMRGSAEKIPVTVKPVYHLPLYDLLSALGAPQRRKKPETYDIKPMRLFSMEDSLIRLRRLFGSMPKWGTLSGFLPSVKGQDPIESKSAIAATFSAVLEMVKAGELDLRQTETFSPIYIKRRTEKQPNGDDASNEEKRSEE